MTTYDPPNGALQCFTSNNAIDFVFGKTILNDSSNNPELLALSDLYQPVPLKANNEWILYAGGTSKSRSLNLHIITVYTGRDLKNLTPMRSGLIIANYL